MSAEKLPSEEVAYPIEQLIQWVEETFDTSNDLMAAMTHNDFSFSFVVDETPPPGLESNVGYTDMNAKTIHINKELYGGLMARAAASQASPTEARRVVKSLSSAFMMHETYHHGVLQREFQDGMRKHPINQELFPKGIKGNLQLEARFLALLHGSVQNALADIFLEAAVQEDILSARPDFERFYAVMTGNPSEVSFLDLAPPEQYLQGILGIGRYHPDIDISGRMSVEAHIAYQRFIERGDASLLHKVEDMTPFDYFSTPTERAAGMKTKLKVYETVASTYVNLFQGELEQRFKSKKSSLAGSSEVGNPRQLTPEEQQEITSNLMGELEEASQSYGPMAPNPDEEQANQRELEEYVESRKAEIANQSSASPSNKVGNAKEKPPAEPDPAAERRRAEAARKQASSGLQREALSKKASEYGVKEDSLTKLTLYTQQMRAEISQIAAFVSEKLRTERTPTRIYGRKEGEDHPFFQYIQIGEALSGNSEPETQVKVEKTADLTEVEILFLVDNSGSMSGTKIQESVKFMVAVVEGFKLAHEDLGAPSSLDDAKSPLKVGIVSFDTGAKIVKHLDTPLTERVEANIVNAVDAAGGGTDERLGLSTAYDELTLYKNNVLKIMVVLTDGQGSKSAVDPYMKKIEEDGDIEFVVVGLGGSPVETNAILQTYVGSFSTPPKHVKTVNGERPSTVLPAFLGILEKALDEKVARHDKRT